MAVTTAAFQRWITRIPEQIDEARGYGCEAVGCPVRFRRSTIRTIGRRSAACYCANPPGEAAFPRHAVRHRHGDLGLDVARDQVPARLPVTGCIGRLSVRAGVAAALRLVRAHATFA